MMHDIKDGRITQYVTNKLAARGFGAQSRLTVQTHNGQVTLSGSVQHTHQKRAAASAISGMSGVKRVNNLITVAPPVKR